MAEDPTFDRRKYPRVRADALVAIARLDDPGTTGRVLDLSLGGIRFRCVDLEVEMGEILRVTLRLSGGEVSVVGKLVRITDIDAFSQDLALAFLELDARARDLFLAEFPEVEGSL